MADTSQPTVFDYATGTQWRLTFNRIPKTTWFCTSANIPGITLGESTYPTPMADMFITGDKLTFDTLSVTFIVDEEELIEKEIVSGVSYSKNESKVTISGILDKPGISAQIFSLMNKNNINVDMIVQNISQDGISANITFTVNNKDHDLTISVLEKNKNLLNYKSISSDINVSKISVIGMGMMSQSGVAEKMFKTLAEKGINILAISTSEIKISVLIDEKYTNIAVKSLHEVYNL